MVFQDRSSKESIVQRWAEEVVGVGHLGMGGVL